MREVDGRNVVVWDEQQRVALVTPTNTIRVYDVSAVAGGGELEQLAELSKETFGLSGAWSLDSPIRYGEGLLVTAREGNGGASRVFSWQLGSGATELAVPVSPASQFFVADPEAGLAFVADKLIYRATKVGGAWVIGAPIGTGTQGRTPLAFDGDDLLIGLQESGRTFAGGGAGAAGGAASGTKSWTAQLERWSSDSELVASYPAVGNPRVATPARGGWLIGETNSFWGSYQAALEWLPPANDQLQTLTSVPVISASDGEDGARGVALGGDRVFAANCESGLLHGVWAGSAVQLTSRWKPSSANAASCDPVGVYVIGDLLVLDGAKLTFARVCGE